MPYFPQNFYRIQLSPEILFQNLSNNKNNNFERKDKIVTTINAISPLANILNYSLLSLDSKSPFEIHAKTGNFFDSQLNYCIKFILD